MRSVLLLAAFVMLSGCAHSAGSYEALPPLRPDTNFMQYTNLHLEAKNKNEVPMTATDRERLVNMIVRKVQVTNRFNEINAATPGPGTLFATVDVTNYDSGNAFLRFLLAGLGQMHIDGVMTLEDPEKTEPLAKYDLSKTFAWGGFYGLSAKIEHIEEGFAETVAQALQTALTSN